jgi:hypothetical protein
MVPAVIVFFVCLFVFFTGNMIAFPAAALGICISCYWVREERNAASSRAIGFSAIRPETVLPPFGPH